jgi:hypothetical protein
MGRTGERISGLESEGKIRNGTTIVEGGGANSGLGWRIAIADGDSGSRVAIAHRWCRVDF